MHSLQKGNPNSIQKRNNNLIARMMKIQNLMIGPRVSHAPLLRSLLVLLLKSKAMLLLKQNLLLRLVQSLLLTILFHSSSQTVTGARELRVRSLTSLATGISKMQPLKAYSNKQSSMVRKQIQWLSISQSLRYTFWKKNSLTRKMNGNFLQRKPRISLSQPVWRI